jgi:hypothetical protein
MPRPAPARKGRRSTDRRRLEHLAGGGIDEDDELVVGRSRRRIAPNGAMSSPVDCTT